MKVKQGKRRCTSSMIRKWLLFICIVEGAIAENPGSVSSDSLSEVQRKSILQLHNAFRSMVQPKATNMLKMEWDDDLKKIAQDFANKCIVAHNPDRHRLAKNYDWVGENIAWGTGACGAKECGDIYEGVKRWFSESKTYDYVSGQCSGKCTLYTQMVWSESSKLGCGAKRCGDRTILVCNYAPGGNYVGQRPYRTGNLSCSECPSGLVCEDNLCTKLDLESSCKNGICRLQIEKSVQDVGDGSTKDTSEEKINSVTKPTGLPATRTIVSEAPQRQMLGQHMLPEGWKEYHIQLTQIDSGMTAYVWGMNGKHTVFFIEADMTLTAVDGIMHHVSAGQDGAWAVGLAGNIFFRRGITSVNPRGTHWEKIPGNLKQIDAGKGGIVWGVNQFDRVFCRIGIEQPDQPFGIGWMRVEGSLKYVSCGEYGCWGVNKRNNVYFRLGITPSMPQGTQWIIVPGKLRMIESGPAGMTVGISDDNDVFVRTDVSLQKPEGSRWVKLDLKFAHVAVGMRGILGILPDGTVAIHSQVQGFVESNPTLAPTDTVPTRFCHTCPCPCPCPCHPEECCAHPTALMRTTPVRTAPPVVQAPMLEPNVLTKSLAALQSQLTPAGFNAQPEETVTNRERLHLTPELANRILKLIELKGNAFEEDHKAAAARGNNTVSLADRNNKIFPVQNQQGSINGDNGKLHSIGGGLSKLPLTPALPAVPDPGSPSLATNSRAEETKATSDARIGGFASDAVVEELPNKSKDAKLSRKPAAAHQPQKTAAMTTASTTFKSSTARLQAPGNPLANAQDGEPARAASGRPNESVTQPPSHPHVQTTRYPTSSLPTAENHIQKHVLRTSTRQQTTSYIHKHLHLQKTHPHELSISHPTRRTPTRATNWPSRPTIPSALAYPNPRLPQSPYSPYSHAHNPPAALNNVPLLIPATAKPKTKLKTHPTDYSSDQHPQRTKMPTSGYHSRWQHTFASTRPTLPTTRAHFTIAAPNPESRIQGHMMIRPVYPTKLPPPTAPRTRPATVSWQLTRSCCAIPDSVCPISRDCVGYIECRGYRGNYKTCEGGKMFNPATNICDYPRNVDCDLSKGHERFDSLPQTGASSPHEGILVHPVSIPAQVPAPMEPIQAAPPREAVQAHHPELPSAEAAPADLTPVPAPEMASAPVPEASNVQPETVHMQAAFQQAYHEMRGQASFVNNAHPRVASPRADEVGVLREVWFGLGLSPLLTSLTNNPRFPANPDEYIVLDKFEAPPNAGDGYGQRLSTYYRAPQTGGYTFFISCDNECELWISPDREEIHSNLILELKHGHFTSFRQWHKYPEEQTSQQVYLQEGEFYFIESFMKEGTGGDDLSVGVKLPNGDLELPIATNLFLIPRARDANFKFATPVASFREYPDRLQGKIFNEFPPSYAAVAPDFTTQDRPPQDNVPGAEMYMALPDTLETFEQSYEKESVKRSDIPKVKSANATAIR